MMIKLVKFIKFDLYIQKQYDFPSSLHHILSYVSEAICCKPSCVAEYYQKAISHSIPNGKRFLIKQNHDELDFVHFIETKPRLLMYKDDETFLASI